MGLSGSKSRCWRSSPARLPRCRRYASAGGRASEVGARLPLVPMNEPRPPAALAGRAAPATMACACLTLPLDFLQGREPRSPQMTCGQCSGRADPELVVPARARRYLHRAGGVQHARCPARRRAALCLRVQLRQPGRARRRRDRRAEWRQSRCRSRWRRCAARWRTARGGHLARYQGRVVLRETAQVPDSDTSFTDTQRWRWYNTNNIWIDLRALRELQAADPAGTISAADRQPGDGRSARPVEHSGDPARVGDGRGDRLDSGARAVHVPRSRFAPVKTTDDLLVMRSDAYELTGDGRMRPSLTAQDYVVTLDKDFTRLLSGFEQRFPAGAPSLRRCRRLRGRRRRHLRRGRGGRGQVRSGRPALRSD